MTESFAMNGGDGMTSYTQNSEYQKEGSNAVRKLIKDAISKSFDTKFLASISNSRFSLVDLGCSVGPNTFFNMQTILEAIKTKYNDNNNNNNKKLEFQVFFNDHVSNDFNTLFSNLPPEKEYFTAGVPGSFYGQLFPSSSIHFAYCSYSLPWLSKVPEELLLDLESPPREDTMKFQSMGASREFRNAYAAQFEEDMGKFLDARAKEIVQGGMMALITPGVPDGIDPTKISHAILFSFFESSLVDMVNEGILSETLVHSFYMPIYCPSAKEMASHVEKDGHFAIEILKMIQPVSKNYDQIGAVKLLLHQRAVFEGVYIKHFGSEITDEIFKRTLEKSGAVSLRLQSAYMGGTEVFLVLKRK